MSFLPNAFYKPPTWPKAPGVLKSLSSPSPLFSPSVTSVRVSFTIINCIKNTVKNLHQGRLCTTWCQCGLSQSPQQVSGFFIYIFQSKRLSLEEQRRHTQGYQVGRPGQTDPILKVWFRMEYYLQTQHGLPMTQRE